MRYDDSIYREVFPREKAPAEPIKVESACETFRPSENTEEQLNNESPVVETVAEEEVEDGVDGNDIGTDS